LLSACEAIVAFAGSPAGQKAKVFDGRKTTASCGESVF
jgi:hypothetical protein